MKRRVLLYLFLAGFPILALLWIVLGVDPVARMEKRILPGEHRELDRIVIHDAWDTLFLELRGGSWFLNGNEEASRLAVENLLWAARNLQLEGLQTLSGNNEPGMKTHITYYEEGKKVLAYSIAPRPGFMLLVPEGSSEIYRVSLPGYRELDLARVFSVRANHYREHMLIDLLPSEIHLVEVEGRGREAYRFTMDATGKLECVLPLTGHKVDPEKLDEISIRLLFSYFTAIRYEDKPEEDEGAGLPEEDDWLGTLKVESFSGERHELKVYSMDAEEGGGKHRFLARVIHNGEAGVLVVKYLYLDVLMRDISRFFKPEG